MRHLRFVREERKAVIAISQGWRLYGEDPVLRATAKAAPSLCRQSVWTRAPAVWERSTDATDCFDQRKCEQERLSLSMLQQRQRFIDILRRQTPATRPFIQSTRAVSSSLTRTSCPCHHRRRPLESDGRPRRRFAAPESPQRFAADDG